MSDTSRIGHLGFKMDYKADLFRVRKLLFSSHMYQIL
jgi:hypothetical protein